jgi:hypothetical protein
VAVAFGVGVMVAAAVMVVVVVMVVAIMMWWWNYHEINELFDYSRGYLHKADFIVWNLGYFNVAFSMT